MFRKEISEKLDSFLGKPLADQTATLFSAYLLLYLMAWRIEYNFFIAIVPVLLFVAVVLALRSYLFTPWFWLLTALVLAGRIADVWHHSSNHDYVIAYMSVMLLLAYTLPVEQRDGFVKRQAKYMFALIMFFAGLQKLLSVNYTEGKVLEMMFLTGRFAPEIMDHEATFATEIAANIGVLHRFGQTFDANPDVKLVWYSPLFHSIAKPLAWLIIISELAVGVLALWFFGKLLFQVALLLFLAGIFIITPEGGFLSLLLILGWSHLPRRQAMIHRIFLFCLLLILSLVITRISFT